MAVTLNIYDLLKTQDAMKDEEWEKAFFQCFTDAKLNLLNDTPQVGPDGWPYMMVEVSEEGSEPAKNMIQWLADKGIGLAVNPQKQQPDFVFTYGMIWNYLIRGEFVTFQDDRIAPGQVTLEEGAKVMSGDPSQEYLPDYVRQILRAFFLQQGVKEPKILLLSLDEGKQFELAFSLDCLGNPPQSEHRGIAEALSWFLPNHYALMLAPEKGLPKFFDL